MRFTLQSWPIQFRGDQLIGDVTPVRLLRDLLFENDQLGAALPSSPAWDCAREYLRQRDELSKVVAEGSAHN